MFNKLNRKMLLISLSLSVLFSSFASIAFSAIDYQTDELTEGQLDEQLEEHRNAPVEEQSGTTPPLEPVAIPQQESVDIQLGAAGDGVPLYVGEHVQLGGESTIDPYDLDETQLEQLLGEGYTIEDIFRADEIGNQRGVDPLVLLEARIGSESLEQVETRLVRETKNQLKDELKQERSSAFAQLRASGLSEDEQTMLVLAQIEEPELTLTELVQAYKGNGKKSVKETVETIKKDRREKRENTRNGDDSTGKGNGNGSLGNDRLIVDGEDLTEFSELPMEIIKKFSEFATTNNVSVKDLLRTYLTEKSHESVNVIEVEVK